MSNVIVIGGGAAGMIAAGRAAERGHRVTLLEKNDRLGKKILITGKGRCNLTNAGDVEDILQNIPGNPYFMYSALYGFDSTMTRNFFEDLGLPTKVERGNRVFPVSDKAADVSQALAKYLKKAGVKVQLSTPVDALLLSEGRVAGVALKNGKTMAADGVIIATGGLSYPGTGSTGDGYGWAKNAGHRVTELRPSLVPLKAKEHFCAELMGLSLKNVAIVIKSHKGKVLYRDFGEMLFTHFGLSGPMILSGSRHILEELKHTCTVEIDLKPALDEKALDARLLRDFQKYANKDFKNALDELLPQRLIPVVIRLSGIEETKKVNAVTKEERKKLLTLLKAFPVTVTGVTGFDQAVITCGGLDTDEINPTTMESKLVSGLYFAGEILDVDAYTGGFNLQIAFSTGYAAGSHI